MVAYSFDAAFALPPSIGSRSPRFGLSGPGTIDAEMSEHTERLEDLGKRIASAKEFL